METSKFVINLGKIKLSNDQISLVSKGLNFCPTPGKPDPGHSRTDLDNLHRRLRLLDHFRPNLDDSLSATPQRDNNWFSTEPFANRKFRCPSTFNPVGAPTLEAIVLTNEQALNSRAAFQRPNWDNLTPGEWLALTKNCIYF